MNARNRGLWTRGTLLAGATAAALTAGLGAVAPVHAASGGHQIHYVNDRHCSSEPPMRTVRISGTNQYGRRVTWSGTSADGRTVLTSGWWWIGAVHVSFPITPYPYEQHVDAYVPAADDDRYVARGEPSVYVDCFGTRKWIDAVITSEDSSNWCISKGNPSGHYTLYTHYLGYVFVGPGEAFQGYALGPNGAPVPMELVRRYGVPDCG